MVKALDSKSRDPSSYLGGTYFLEEETSELSSATQTIKPNTVIAMKQINHNHFYFGHSCMTQESRKSSLDHFLIGLLGPVIQSGVQSEVTFKSFKSYPN